MVSWKKFGNKRIKGRPPKMKNRLKAIDDKYPDVSKWIKELFQKWLIFDSELVEEDVIS